MVRQPVRFALLLGAIITAAAVSPARADDKAPPATTQPATRTIQVTECVPETYKVKRTVYRMEKRTEEVDGFRCENVPEVRERTVTCVKRVPVETWEVKKVCKNVTEYVEKTVMKNVHRTVQETVMEKKLVRLGHWECYEKECCFAGLFSGCHHNKCCDPCDPCCNEAPRTVTKKRWVCCPEYQCCPKTVCKKVCVQEPVTCKVPVCRQVWTEEKVKVCKIQCVEEKKTEKYTVCVQRKVACKVTRTVCVCVPHEEEVTCTRMVARTVERQVADCAPTSNACAPANNCCDRGHRCCFRDLFSGCHHRNHDCCRQDCR